MSKISLIRHQVGYRTEEMLVPRWYCLECQADVEPPDCHRIANIGSDAIKQWTSLRVHPMMVDESDELVPGAQVRLLCCLAWKAFAI